VKIVIRWRPLALFGLALLGLALRLYGINWDQGNSFHPDERQILFHVMALSWPKSFGQFLNPVTSPLNPHFFAYGSFPLYLLATLGNIIAHIYPGINTMPNLTLLGRVLSALFDTGTILLTGWLGLILSGDTAPGRKYGWNLALFAAALVTFTPFEIQQAHFYAVDTLLLFFITLTLLASVALVSTDAPIRWSLVAGLGYGLALSTKFSAAPLAVPIIVALLLHWYKRDFYSSLLSLLITACVTIVVFLVTMPYALLDSPNFVQQVSFQGQLARGLIDLPYVRQFAGTTPYLYEFRDMLFWGFGLMLGIAAFAGLGWMLWRVWKRTIGPWLVLLSWIVVYGGIVGSFYVKYMRYMLPIYPFLILMASALLLAPIARRTTANRVGARFIAPKTRHIEDAPVNERTFAPLPDPIDAEKTFTPLPDPIDPERTFASPSHPVGRDQSGPYAVSRILRRIVTILPYAAIVVVLAGTIFQGLALLNVYSVPSTRIQASIWIYQHVKPGSVLTYEQWDDPLPYPVGTNNPYIYQQATYQDASGQTQTGLDLYGADTTAKAQQLAKILPTVNVLTMATDRLDKSIPRLPFRYPLTIHYYQLLFSGQLGFHLAAKFSDRPNLLGITLNDSSADESYSVFDHPTVKIFVRDNPYPYTSQQLYQKLMAGVQLPAPGAQLSGAQKPLLLTPQQIAQDQQSPPFSVQFPASSPSNKLPFLFWWLAILVLGWLAFPIIFSAFRGMRDRGYIFSKTIGILLMAYLTWMLANLHVLPFSFLSTLLSVVLLLLVAAALFFLQRKTVVDFLRSHWRLILIEEIIFTLAFLLFVGIRSLNPDLWNPYIGGEKPMELAFLNAILRSPYMPPLDPWFSGGYINYYYYGYIIFGAMIKLTAIVPTTAFNLTMPTLFALTFTSAVSIVYTLSSSFPIALLGGYFAAMIGNLDGLGQLKGQIIAFLSHAAVPGYNYWQSSRVIPYTINEFPYWSFLFSDLHPHVMDLPIEMLMLGIVAMLLRPHSALDGSREERFGTIALYLVAAFVFGTIATVNPWDMPVFALLLATALIVHTLYEKRREPKLEIVISLGFTAVGIALICGLGYLFYWPFYHWYEELYVNGLGPVSQPTALNYWLTVFGFWFFLALSFILFEFYRWLSTTRSFQSSAMQVARRVAGYLLFCVVALTFLALLGVRPLLLSLIVLGGLLAINMLLQYLSPRYAAKAASSTSKTSKFAPQFDLTLSFTFLVLLMGLCITLGQEIVYIRDFMDGGAYYRMNTVFKFSMPAWLCFGVGGALAVQRLWHNLCGFVKRVWSVALVLLILSSSVFLVEGTAARIGDHQLWAQVSPPAYSANYTPTLDGFAFVRSWYPGDAQAITWLNDHISGSPVILEGAAPASYQWYNRVSVYTGLPDVLGWPDHEEEQRYAAQVISRANDINTIYSTPDASTAISLLHFYHVRYIYVGALEQQLYGQSSPGLEKFQRMVGSSLRVVYNVEGVTIYEVLG
jgi:YYY domain-containing protein